MFTNENLTVGMLFPVRTVSGRVVKGVVSEVYSDRSVTFTVVRSAVSKGIAPKRCDSFEATVSLGESLVRRFSVLFPNGSRATFRVSYSVKAKEGFDLWTAYCAYYRGKVTLDEFLMMVEISASYEREVIAFKDGLFNSDFDAVRAAGFDWKSFFRPNVLDSITRWDAYYASLEDSCSRVGSAVFTYGT